MRTNKGSKSKKIRAEKSSGNVFADLGLPEADELSIQAELVRLIYLRIKELGLTQVQAANRLGLKQPDVSTLIAGRVHKFSLERLLRCVRRLDRDVVMVIRPKRNAGVAQTRRSSARKAIAA